MMRGIAQSVPFNVANGAVWPSLRMRIFNRRAWYSVVFDVLVTSRYAPWVGIHASMSNFFAALGLGCTIRTHRVEVSRVETGRTSTPEQRAEAPN